jgi:hypothetical protein
LINISGVTVAFGTEYAAPEGAPSTGSGVLITPGDVLVGDVVAISVELDEVPNWLHEDRLAAVQAPVVGEVRGPLPRQEADPHLDGRIAWVGALTVRTQVRRQLPANDSAELVSCDVLFAPVIATRNIGPRNGKDYDEYAKGRVVIELLSRDGAAVQDVIAA